jgi:hypothetical protein
MQKFNTSWTLLLFSYLAVTSISRIFLGLGTGRGGVDFGCFSTRPHPTGFAKSNPSPEHNQQYPHGFGCCGAGKIAAGCAGCTGCAGWVLFLHFRLISSPSFSCLLIYIFFFLLHNHKPKSKPINNEKEREIGLEISWIPFMKEV